MSQNIEEYNFTALISPVSLLQACELWLVIDAQFN
jgi:hypothetical protein